MNLALRVGRSQAVSDLLSAYSSLRTRPHILVCDTDTP
jgi:hypothetical protein